MSEVTEVKEHERRPITFGAVAAAPAGDRRTLEVSGASKRFGTTQAVAEASLSVDRGELVGIAGHNGAGKSTLLNIVTGRLTADTGTVRLRGTSRDATRRAPHAGSVGIRVVHQELSLAPTLRVDEVAAVQDHSVSGLRWRRTAWRRLRTVLDEMFPAHGIRPGALVGDLSLSRRQMIECACAMLPGREPPSLLILDEPTSSLDSAATASFYAFLRPRADAGLSAVVTTHRLHEMVDHLDRIYVMRDGHVVDEQRAREATKESLVRAMGVATHRTSAPVRATPATAAAAGDAAVRAEVTQDGRGEDGVPSRLELRAGEVVGLGGLEGHGQLEFLEALSRSAASARRPARHTAHQRVRLAGTTAYVSGDRGVRGIFRYWSVARNLSISSLGEATRRGFISRAEESGMVLEWRDRLGIKGAPSDPIVRLSGGSQQKVLMARALATGSDVLLLEDPTRGVDQSTKEDFYALLRDLAKRGKCVVWYSTENEELRHCDRVVVFRGGLITAVLRGADATEDEIISRSFAEAR
jgi:ribose transport system ATP-binding protein